MGGVDAVHHQATLADGGSTSRLALKDWQGVDSSRGLRGWLVGVIGLCDTGGRRWRRWQRREVLRDLRIVSGKLVGEVDGHRVGEHRRSSRGVGNFQRRFVRCMFVGYTL